MIADNAAASIFLRRMFELVLRLKSELELVARPYIVNDSSPVIQLLAKKPVATAMKDLETRYQTFADYTSTQRAFEAIDGEVRACLTLVC